MATVSQPAALEAELDQALDDLVLALQQAGAAAAAIRSLAPRLAATGSVLDEIAALVASGRQEIPRTAPEATPRPEPGYTRPTLVPPSAPAARTRTAAKRPVGASPAAQIPSASPPEGAAAPAADIATATDPASKLDLEPAGGAAREPSPFPSTGDSAVTCFRLEFESASGPLDLRRVDEAVAAHPAVRDVALLDYDGRRATLKVWIAATSTPSDVQQALKQRAADLFVPGDDVRIVALEDAA